ncbi:MAG: DUF4190 domain-containing protein, partial [Pyrinomonadaceae bacterium]
SNQPPALAGRPPLPGQLRVVGYGNLVVGPLLAIVNLFVVGASISELERRNAPEGLSTFFEINIVIFCVLGALLVIGGVGLIRNRRWGRIWSLIGGVSCLLSLMAVSVMNNIMQSLLSSGAIPLRPGQQSFYFKGVSGVTGLAPLYGILIIVLLLLPAAREWARGGATQGTSDGTGLVGADAAPAASRPTSGLAIASLVCSLIPFALITQIAGLILGIIALVKIRKSQGTLGGKGFATAGVIISSLAILFIGGVIAIIGLSGGFK